MNSSQRSIKEISLDFVLGLLFVAWHILTFTFPAFHFIEFDSLKFALVSFLAPIIFLILVIVRVFRKKRKFGDLLSGFFTPETNPIAVVQAERFLMYAAGWVGILLGPTLGASSAEKYLGLDLYRFIFWCGSIFVLPAGANVIWKRMEFLDILYNKKFYLVCGTLLVWWSWAELINMIELLDRAPWVFFELPYNLKQFLGL